MTGGRTVPPVAIANDALSRVIIRSTVVAGLIVIRVGLETVAPALSVTVNVK